jgi:hypothetical protein
VFPRKPSGETPGKHQVIELFDRGADRGEPIRLIEFGHVRVVAFFVAALVSGAIWLTGLWHVGKWLWGLL